MIEPSIIWDDKRVNAMAEVWRNPNELLGDDTILKYDRHWRLINEIYKLIEGNSVLDVGCGMGHLFALVKNKFDYIGVDGSESMIRVAKHYFLDNANQFQFGDVYNLTNFPNVDTVVASGLLLHLAYPEIAIKQLWNKVNKCLIFSVWIGKTPLMWQGRQPLIKRMFGIKEHTKLGVIQRRETIDDIKNRIQWLDGVKSYIYIPFNNPHEGESNYIFKVNKNV